MAPDEATLRQVAAANPGHSTWLSANAGSGKTSVLTDRVARLLLGGTDPAHVLCLTYTKAAATEMQNRLFRRLGEWAMAPDNELAASLSNLGLAGPYPAVRLAQARRLFARAIETPGGLRIQTIHSFCAGLLRRFPLEAGVSPRFAELDDRSARLARDEILQDMAQGPGAAAVGDLARLGAGARIDKVLAAIVAIPPDQRAAMTPAAAFQALGVPPDESIAAILADAFTGTEPAILAGLLPALAASGPSDAKAAEALGRLGETPPGCGWLEVCERVFLFGASANTPFGAKVGAFPTKALREGALAGIMPALNSWMERIERARSRRVALEAAQASAAFYRFASDFLARYGALKSARGWLDFDDLIHGALRLLSAPGVAAWVLYRLDGGIEHILVDEAQDTSPAQWRVIEALAAEFTAGDSAHPGARTLFVVGDKKQSIYSFQGANVAIFDDRRDSFRAGFTAAAQTFETMTLEVSFRSSPVILGLVDATFQDPALAPAVGHEVRHAAFRQTLPGRVELWPLVTPEDDPEPGDWQDPVDLPGPRHHTIRLAEAIATRLRAMLDEGAQIIGRDGQPRPITAGDFLILVQTRGRLFNALIRACKAARLPIAGADRLKLASEIAVRDLTSLLSFLAMPEDDLALAECLRSPLIGLDEDALFRLASGRKGYLWETLRARAAEYPQAVAILHDLRDQVDYLRPYDLIERILVRHDGRRRLIARLGEEAEEGIDAFLQQALDHEGLDVPSLTGFLVWLQDDDVEIKRQADSAGERLRIMTVHGAKGLEAEIVILPDCADQKARRSDSILLAEGAPPLWSMPEGHRPKAMADRIEGRSAMERDENLRLLYVAMTRARAMLIVAAAGEARLEVDKKPKPLADLCWYRLVEQGLSRLNPVTDAQGRRVVTFGDWPAPLGRAVQPAQAAPPILPGWVRAPHRAPDAALPALSPSDLGGAKALPGEEGAEGETARAHGSALHLLLEHLPGLPPQARAARAAALVPDPALCAAVLAEAEPVFDDPALAWIFAPGSLAEVALTGDWRGRRMLGAIDRLILTPDTATFIDFKSNRVLPATPSEVPEGILRQMGAYRHLLAAVLPGRILRPAILWTAGPRLMPLDPDIVSAALDRTTIP